MRLGDSMGIKQGPPRGIGPVFITLRETTTTPTYKTPAKLHTTMRDSCQVQANSKTGETWKPSSQGETTETKGEEVATSSATDGTDGPAQEAATSVTRTLSTRSTRWIPVSGIPELMPESVEKRKEFETAMARIHPDAPAIKIENTIDESPCPEPDFQWVKEMIMGDGVPEKQASNGCGCTGPCDPSSTTCTCVIRQGSHSDKRCTGFMYDVNGRFQFGDSPIVECNKACGCTADCPNKVSCQARWTKRSSSGIVALLTDAVICTGLTEGP